MSDALMRAPEVKSADADATAAYDEFMQAFEAFKSANDERLDEIEKKLTADVVTTEKVERINRAMDEQKKVVDQMLLKARRPQLGLEGGRAMVSEWAAPLCSFSGATTQTSSVRVLAMRSRT